MIGDARSAGWAGLSAAALMLCAMLNANGQAAEHPAGPQGTPAGQTPPDAVKRGEYLVKGVGCGDCHTPHKMGPAGPEADESLLFAGHPAAMTVPKPPDPSGPWIASVTGVGTAWAGPWGISYTANLTPHETGLGAWTEQQFIDAIRSGRHQGRGRPILPPMPWQAFSNFTDDDLKAMFAYLRTLKPVENKVPDPVIAEAAAKP